MRYGYWLPVLGHGCGNVGDENMCAPSVYRKA